MKLRIKMKELCSSCLRSYIRDYSKISQQTRCPACSFDLLNLRRVTYIPFQFSYPGDLMLIEMLRFVLICMVACVFAFQLSPTHLIQQASLQLSALKDMVMAPPDVREQGCNGQTPPLSCYS